MGGGRCDVEDENGVERRGLWRFLGGFFSSYWGCEGRAENAFCCSWTVERGVNSSRGVCARVEAAVPGRPSVEVVPESPGKSAAGSDEFGRDGLDCDLIRTGYEFNILLYDRHWHYYSTRFEGLGKEQWLLISWAEQSKTAGTSWSAVSVGPCGVLWRKKFDRSRDSPVAHIWISQWRRLK